MRRTLLAAVVACSLCFSAVRAAAESAETDAVTIGALAERADVAAVAVAVAEAREPGDESSLWSFRVEEALRGTSKDATLDVRLAVAMTPVARGGKFLLFLTTTSRGELAPLELPWSVRTTAESGVAALVDYARGYAACLGKDGTVARPETLAAHLVASLSSDASGVPHCAGRDLLRHEDDLRPVFTAELRDGVTAALRRPRTKPDHDFAGVVLAAGPFGGAGADALLVERLLDPALRTSRRHVVQSLARRSSAELAAALTSHVAAATPEQRADLAFALGRLDRAEAGPGLLRLVGDETASVRIEAAHGLGLLARAVRVPQPGADPDAQLPKLAQALDPLAAALVRAGTENERRAALWAIAQIDTPAAWEFLRKASRESAEPRVRDLAAQVLARPRVSLLLE